MLNGLAGRQDVIALNFAVTYWDQLGWKDTFAKPAYTARQWDYVARDDDPCDARYKIVTLTDSGQTIIERAAEPAQRARERALEVFSVRDATKFLELLERFVGAFNEQTRAPIHATIKEKWLARS